MKNIYLTLFGVLLLTSFGQEPAGEIEKNQSRNYRISYRF